MVAQEDEFLQKCKELLQFKIEKGEKDNRTAN